MYMVITGKILTFSVTPNSDHKILSLINLISNIIQLQNQFIVQNSFNISISNKKPIKYILKN